MLERLKDLVGRRVAITFESKKFNGLYTQTGILLKSDDEWTYLDDWDGKSNYPRGSAAVINTSHIRSIHEVAVKQGDFVRIKSDFKLDAEVFDWLSKQKENRFEVIEVNFDKLIAKVKGCTLGLDIDDLQVVA